MSKPLSDWEKAHQLRLDAFTSELESLFNLAVDEAVSAGLSVPAVAGKPFQFRNYPALTDRINALVAQMTGSIQVLIGRGTAEAWDAANQKTEAMLVAMTQQGQLDPSVASRYMGVRNQQAYQAFQVRKTAGLNLSQRVFHYVGQFKQELETNLSVGIEKGLSAAKLAQQVQRYLRDPDTLFHRVRNACGQLVLSRPARQYHPGQGVYRSAFKNAARLARTEINTAYREADALRYQSLDFVVGFEVRRSNRGSICDRCESLKGRYPKTFVFRGWHPQCRCYTVSILATPQELQRLNEMTLAGEDTGTFRSVNEVTQPHQGWNDWIEQNRDRMAQGTKPLFVQQNAAYIPAPTPPVADPATRFTADGWQIGLPADFNRNYLATAPQLDIASLNREITEIVTRQGIAITERRISVFDDQFQVKFEGNLKGEYFSLQRSFYRHKNELYVDHDLFVVPKSLQRKGLSKEVFQSLYKHYQQAGVDKIRVHANIDVGGYAWAQYGFTFETQADRRMVYNRAIQRLKPDELIKFKSVWNVVKDEPVFPLHTISAIPEIGKKILLNSDWNGILDLTDPKQRSLFERYLFRK